MLKLIAITCAAVAVGLAADSASFERGKYLAEEVAKCQNCHTPRLETGEFDKSKWMKGSLLDFGPLHEIKTWHKNSPDITGTGRLFQRWKVESVVKFLETGLNPNGGKADPPMPTYMLKHDDAQAIVDYLKTLP